MVLDGGLPDPRTNSKMKHTALDGLRMCVAAAALAAAAFAQTPLTYGNLLVTRVGDGTATLSGVATPVFVDEYTTSGTLVQSIAMPTVASGLNQAFTNSGSASSEGFLNISTNGLYVLLTGYNAAPGTTAIAGTANPPVSRVIARIDLAGVVDTSTALTDAYTVSNIRSVASDDGSRFWISGSTQGIRFVANLGDTTSVLVGVPPTNVRCLNVYNGQLWGTSGSSGFVGLWKAGNGLPTLPATAGGVIEPGFTGATGPSPYDFHFASPTTVYIADDRSNGSGGIYRYDFVGGTWVQAYVLAASATAGYRGLSGFTQNGVTTLYATAIAATTTTPNSIVSVVDTGAGSTFTTIATASPNTAFRGIRFFGLPSTLLRIPAACGPMDISTTGNGQIGTDVVTTLKTPTGFGFIGFGTTSSGFPLCGCTLVHEYSALLFGSQIAFPIPNNPIFAGAQIYIQGVDLDLLAAPGCLGLPPFTVSDGYQFTVQ